MMSDAYVRINCNKCEDEVEVQMCALAGGGYDDRNVTAHLERMGWKVISDDEHICDSCLEDDLEGEPVELIGTIRDDQ